MARFVQALVGVVLAVLWMPAGGFSEDKGIMGGRSSDGQATNKSVDPAMPRDLRSRGESVKQPAQGDVQTRGLFSRKKKKLAGGAAGHTESSGQGDLPAQSGSVAGK